MRVIFTALCAAAVTLLWPVAPTQAQSYEAGHAAFEAGEHKRAIEIWQPLANAGDTYAQFAIGNAYSNGHGVEKSLSEAIEWYLKAANKGLAAAQYNLAFKYHHTQDVRDYAKAAEWYRRAAEQGHLNAMVNLGALYMSGLGVTKDDVRAAQQYVRAATQGHPLAQSYLGDMYRWGRGVEQDHDKAVYWYRESAEQGECEGLLNLATAHMQGRGVFKDRVLAYVFATHNPKSHTCDLPARSKLADALGAQLSNAQRTEVSEITAEWDASKAIPVRSRTGEQ